MAAIAVLAGMVAAPLPFGHAAVANPTHGAPLAHVGPMDLTAAARALLPPSHVLRPIEPFGPASNLTWTDLTPDLTASTPPARFIAQMTYDPVDHGVLLFGGDAATILGDTWLFTNGSWVEQFPSDSPGGRAVAMMTYDALDGYVLLFGGYNEGGTYYNDTWSFAHGQWTQITTSAHAPSPRWRSVIAYDAVDQYVLLFGGTDSTSAVLSDTWTYAAGNWTDITSKVTGTPPGTYRASAVWDAADGYVLMFGGCGTLCPTAATYSYVNLTWKDLSSSDGKAPAARVYTALTYDNATGTVLMFGGAAGTGGPGTADTWWFTGGKWYDQTANQSISPYMDGWQTMAYDPDFSSAIMFGGSPNSGASNNITADTWAYGPLVPIAFAVQPSGVELGQSVTITTAAFSNYRPLNFSYSGLPSGCSSGNVTQIQCTPSVTGSFVINVSAMDTKGRFGNASAALLVAAAPTLGSFVAAPALVTVGAPVTFTTTIDGGVPPLAFHYVRLPGGCGTVNAASFTCTPTSAGSFHVEVLASDSYGYPIYGNTTLVVNPKGTIESFTASPAQVDVNGSTSLNVTVANGTGPFSYVYTNLPAGCVTQNTDALPCAPTVTGSFAVSVTATDVFGFAAHSSVLTLQVNAALQITTFVTSAPAVDAMSPVQFQVVLAGGSGSNALSYGGLPPGCALGSSATPSCTPTQPGTYNITVNATDAGNGFASASVMLTVLVGPTATMAVSQATVDVSQPFSVNVTVVGGIGPFRYSYTGIPATCLAQGANANFTCSAPTAGSIAAKVVVTDADQRTATANVTVLVVPDPSVKSVDIAPGSPTVNQPVTLTVTATGGSGTYTYKFVGLPAGCSSSNRSTLTCTPTATGNFPVTIYVTDSRGLGGSGSTYLNVSSAASGDILASIGGTTTVVVLVVVVAVVAVLAVVMMRRRRGRAPPTVYAEAPTDSDSQGPWEEPPT